MRSGKMYLVQEACLADGFEQPSFVEALFYSCIVWVASKSKFQGLEARLDAV